MLTSSLISLASPRGLIVAGPLAEVFSVQSWFMVGGVVVFVGGAAGFFIPAIYHIEDRRKKTAPSDIAAAGSETA